MKSFTIMTDTGCDMPQEFLDANDIKIIPIPFNIDGVEHEDGRFTDISDKEFYEKLGSGSKAGTALINPESFEQVFTEYAERNEDLLVLLLSSGLSGTAQNAVIALYEVREKYPDCKIFPVDSLNASGGFGLFTYLAVAKRAEGLSIEETANWLEEKKQSCFSLFTVDDLMYLYRGGRLSKIQAVAGTIIGVKPLLNVHPDGSLKLKDKARGRKASMEALASQLKRSLNPDTKLDTVIIIHSNCENDANLLADIVRSKVDVNKIIISMMGPVIGAHVGPGCIALFFEADMTRTEYEEKFYNRAK